MTGALDAGSVIVTKAEADFVVSAALVAFTVTVAGLGTVAGAAYSPEVEMVPVVELPPVNPLTLQVTALLLLPVTTALNCWDAPVRSEALVGLTLTATGCEAAL